MRLKSQFAQIAAMAVLMGWLPILIMWGIMEFALAHGARDWPDLFAFPLFGGLYLGLVALGAMALNKITD